VSATTLQAWLTAANASKSLTLFIADAMSGANQPCDMMSERVIGGTASAAEASGINGGGGGKKDAMQWRRVGFVLFDFVTPQTLTKLIRQSTLPVDERGSGKM
jgi:hypothetical protein